LVAVQENDKQRFTITPVPALIASANPPANPPIADSDPSHYLIRANQGHSLQVDSEGLLEPVTIEKGNLPPLCIHGTTKEAWRGILRSGGLKRMGRSHVHFARGLPKGWIEVADGAEERKDKMEASNTQNEDGSVDAGGSTTILTHTGEELQVASEAVPAAPPKTEAVSTSSPLDGLKQTTAAILTSPTAIPTASATLALSTPLPQNVVPVSVEPSAASKSTSTDSDVISGFRSTSQILIYIDLPLALSHNLKFWQSSNGVVLSEGDPKTGLVPLEVFGKVEERSVLGKKGSGKVIMKEGKLIDNASVEAGDFPPEEVDWEAETIGGKKGTKSNTKGKGKGKTKPKLRVEADEEPVV
jgi:RNA:NAD 2'-phosphotransferase (TPT1/KptA family)